MFDSKTQTVELIDWTDAYPFTNVEEAVSAFHLLHLYPAQLTEIVFSENPR